MIVGSENHLPVYCNDVDFQATVTLEHGALLCVSVFSDFTGSGVAGGRETGELLPSPFVLLWLCCPAFTLPRRESGGNLGQVGDSCFRTL